jgi:hypothetical protein
MKTNSCAIRVGPPPLLQTDDTDDVELNCRNMSKFFLVGDLASV